MNDPFTNGYTDFYLAPNQSPKALDYEPLWPRHRVSNLLTYFQFVMTASILKFSKSNTSVVSEKAFLACGRVSSHNNPKKL